jgi:hypothetical protein
MPAPWFSSTMTTRAQVLLLLLLCKGILQTTLRAATPSSSPSSSALALLMGCLYPPRQNPPHPHEPLRLLRQRHLLLMQGAQEWGPSANAALRRSPQALRLQLSRSRSLHHRTLLQLRLRLPPCLLPSPSALVTASAAPPPSTPSSQTFSVSPSETLACQSQHTAASSSRSLGLCGLSRGMKASRLSFSTRRLMSQHQLRRLGRALLLLPLEAVRQLQLLHRGASGSPPALSSLRSRAPCCHRRSPWLGYSQVGPVCVLAHAASTAGAGALVRA